MRLPFGFGNVDFADWARGIVAAFVSGGASAVTSGVVVSLNDPKDYAIGTAKFMNLVMTVFVMAGTLGALAFLRNKPIPEMKTVKTTVEETAVSGAPVKLVTTVEETHMAPVVPSQKDAE